MRSLLLALPLALLLTACASTSGGSGSLLLGPSGRVQGVIKAPAGSETTFRMANRGPGRADFVIREDGGDVWQEGPLGETQATTSSTEPVFLIVVAEAYEDSETNISWQLISDGGSTIKWNLDGQFRGGR